MNEILAFHSENPGIFVAVNLSIVPWIGLHAKIIFIPKFHDITGRGIILKVISSGENFGLAPIDKICTLAHCYIKVLSFRRIFHQCEKQIYHAVFDIGGRVTEGINTGLLKNQHKTSPRFIAMGLLNYFSKWMDTKQVAFASCENFFIRV